MLTRKVEDSSQGAPLDRRRAERHETRQTGWLRAKSGVTQILIVDYSTGGLGVTVLAPTPLEVGEAIEVAVGSSAGQRWVAGKIMWCDGAKAGVSFLGSGRSVVDQMKTAASPTPSKATPPRQR